MSAKTPDIALQCESDLNMNEPWQQLAQRSTGAHSIIRGDSIQSLWSGYGEIFRVQLQGADVDSLIVKHIAPGGKTGHPRGWNTDFAMQRKIHSYEVERYWYDHYNNSCHSSRVAHCYGTYTDGRQSWIIMEDLDASGYPQRFESLDLTGAKVCLQWLARFHASFLQREPKGLWPTGTYWHLDTRPDELQSMPEGKLRQHAAQLDSILNQCRFSTLVHGDAKVANFCFSADGGNVAAVDFQYVGKGCGMKDVAYFIGSCLDEQTCIRLAPQLLDSYFAELAVHCRDTAIDFPALEKEWRDLYPVAWTDFYRFLAGWMPTHRKIHRYTLQLAESAFTLLSR